MNTEHYTFIDKNLHIHTLKISMCIVAQIRNRDITSNVSLENTLDAKLNINKLHTCLFIGVRFG